MTEAPDALRAIWRAQLVELRAYPYAAVGVECAEVNTASGVTVRFRAHEVIGSPLETYGLQIEESSCSAGGEDTRGRTVVTFAAPLDRIELCWRDEWAEPYTEQHRTVGSSPIAVTTGPVGGAPKGIDGTTVLCGVVLQTEPPSSQFVLIYVSDYPGLISWTCDTREIAAYRTGVTCEFL